MSEVQCEERFFYSRAMSLFKRTCITGLSTACLLLFSIFLATGSVFANDENRIDDPSIDISDPHLSWTPGEMYDPMTGQMRHHMVDMIVEGNSNRLPIVVSRSIGFSGTIVNDVFSSLNYEVGYLDTPTLSYRYRHSDELSDCRDLYLTADSDNPRAKQELKSLIKFSMGTEHRFFFSTDPDDQPADVSQYDDEVSYVSSDNWLIKCVDTDQNGLYEFLIQSPDGLNYLMNKMFSPERNADAHAYARVSSVSDAYGNSLTYEYENGNTAQRWTRSRPDKLLQIVASDDRQVSFTYNNFGNLVRVTSNGTPRPQVVDYKYEGLQSLNGSQTALFEVHRNNLLTTQYYSSSFFNVLLKVVYPTGGWVEYTYNTEDGGSPSTQFNQYNIGRIATLTEREQSDGGVYRFEHTERGGKLFSRIIRTPVSIIDYRYQKSSYRFDYREPRVTEVNDGQLLKKTISVQSDASTREISSTEYSYARRKWQSHYQTIDTQFVVKTLESRTLDGSKKFITSYSGWNEFGQPQSIIERNPAGLRRETTRAYLNVHRAYWISGKVQNETVSDGTYQFNLYNTGGDRIAENNTGIETSITYHLSGPSRSQIHTVTDGEGNSTRYEDYHRGVARLQVDKTGLRITRSVNDDGTISSETRLGDSAAWLYRYDALQRQNFVRSPRAATLAMNTEWLTPLHRRSYDSLSENWSETVLDSFGRVIFEGKKDNQLDRWRSVVYRYDVMGNRIFESYPTDVSVDNFRNNSSVVGITTEYDALNRPVRITRELGGADSRQTLQYGSNNEGFLLTTQVDSRSNVSTTTFNSFGLPHYRYKTRHVDKNGVVTTYERDLMGRLDSVTRSGVTRTYTRNDKKQLVATSEPEKGNTTFSYYSDGMLRQSFNNGRSINYVYDAENRVEKVTHNDVQGGWVSRDHEYDNHGNRVLLRNSSNDNSQNNSISYTFDKEDNVLTESFGIDSLDYTISYEYDKSSSLEATRYPSGRRYQYSPNVYGEPTKIVSDDGKVIYQSLLYYPTGAASQMVRSSHFIRTMLDAGQRPSSRAILYPNGVTQAAVDYTYDTESNVRTITDGLNGSSQTFEHDELNRLTSAKFSDGEDWTFVYDANDNLARVQQGGRNLDYNYAADTQRLTSISSSSNPERRFGYDAHGNMTSIDMPVQGQSSAVVSRALEFNAANQVVRVNTQPSSSNYEYDGRGLRIKTTQDGIVYTFYDSNRNLRYRHDLSTNVVSEYFYVANQIVGRRDTQYSSSSGNSSGDGGSNTSGGSGAANQSARPATPAGLVATVSGSSVALTWNSVEGADKYNIVRDDDYLATVNQLSSYTDNQVSAGTHSYYVIAEDADLPEDIKLSESSSTVTVSVGN